MKSNRRMRALAASSKPPKALPKRLAGIIQQGFVRKSGCILFASEAQGSRPFKESALDKTGYECLMNHIHISRFPTAHLFATDLVGALRKRFLSRFVVILSFNGDGATVRFHKLRRGEAGWISDDLESYKNEAVGVLYSR